MRRWADRYGFWLALLIFAGAYYRRFISSAEGMALYPHAAQCLLDNQSLPTCEVWFTYPPAFAFIMIPFAPAPLWLREPIWYVITIGVSVGAFRVCERLAARLFSQPFSRDELIWVRAIALILSIKFVLAVLENQAYDTFAFIFIVLGLAGLATGRGIAGGASLGFAAAIKATPLIFLPYLLFKKKFAAAAAFVTVLFAASYAPDVFFTQAGAAHGYFHTWLRLVAGASIGIDPQSAPIQFWYGANALNHSLRGAVSLRIDEAAHAGLFKMAVIGVDLVFIAFAAALIAIRKAERDMIAIDGSILLIAMLMLSPMSSRSHYIVLVLPYVTLTMVMLRDQVTQRLGIAVLATSFFFLTLTSNDVVGKAVSDFAYSRSFLVIGALVLMIYIAAIVWTPAVLHSAKPFAWRRTKPSRV